MLFATEIATQLSTVANLENRIDELESVLQSLRTEKSAIEAEIQTMRTLEGAAESALEQTQKFQTAAQNLNRPDLVATFWQAMTEISQATVQKLPEPTPEPQPEPTTANATAPTPAPDAVEVEATEVNEPETAPEPTPETTTANAELNGKTPYSNGNGNGNGNGKSVSQLLTPLTYEELNGITIQTIRKLAASKKVSGKGKRTEIATRLLNLVTQADLEALN